MHANFSYRINILHTLLFLLICMLPPKVSGQVSVTFCIDLHELIDSGYYKTPEDRILVRGSFNNWSGFDAELFAERPRDSLFCTTYEIMAELGDTVDYKFVIVSSSGIEYWENEPNPENPEHGNRIFVTSGDQLILPVARFDCGEDIKGPRLAKEQLYREDFIQMREALEEYHPSLYDYTSKESLDSLFDHYDTLIDSTVNYGALFQYISSVLARVGCGHTKLWIPSAYWDAAPDHFFPLQLIFTQGKVFVSGCYYDHDLVPVGAELLSINGMPVAVIISELKALESSDGFIESFKMSSIQKRFPKRYAMFYGFPEEFKMSYIPPGDLDIREIILPPASRRNVESVPPRGEELSFKELAECDAALMTINTFIYYDQVEMFHAFIDSCFREMKDRSIGNLIIDLRGNDGGDPFCAYYLFSYLQKEPVPYFADRYGKYDTLADPIPLPENHCTGKVYVLIDGSGFSTTGHLCGLLKYHNLVIFVGTDLGSTFTCTGNVKYLNLEHSRLILGTARERRYTAAVKNMDPQQGIRPDYLVETTQKDIVEGRDGQLEFVLELITKW